ncbi:MAG: ImmA/IrrE family metallo-endopeptidase [Halanaerobiales bacterium]|nr:ImmA/IrrE family metallo-endopeptidase [Halanaerobiales bacterium]
MNNLKLEAQSKANKIRNRLGFGNEPIQDLFNLVEILELLLVKKPLDRESLSALYLNHKDNRLVLINTSKSLGHQYFSFAHELYHYFYDTNINSQICNTFKFKKQKAKNEILADYFAVHFLMPHNSVINFFDNIDKEIGLREVIKAMHYFKVSYQAMLIRMKVLGIIDDKKYRELKDEHLSSVLPKLGYELDLIRPTKITEIPKKYTEYLTENYEADKISFSTLKIYLEEVGKSLKDIDYDEEAEDVVEETSFDY